MKEDVPRDEPGESLTCSCATERNGRKTLTTVQGIPKKFSSKRILSTVKKQFACNGTIVTDSEMGEVIQLQGDQRKAMHDFLVDKKSGLEMDPKTIKVRHHSTLPPRFCPPSYHSSSVMDPSFLSLPLAPLFAILCLSTCRQLYLRYVCGYRSTASNGHPMNASFRHWLRQLADNMCFLKPILSREGSSR